jgi:hypothetical protein
VLRIFAAREPNFFPNREKLIWLYAIAGLMRNALRDRGMAGLSQTTKKPEN